MYPRVNDPGERWLRRPGGGGGGGGGGAGGGATTPTPPPPPPHPARLRRNAHLKTATRPRLTRGGVRRRHSRRPRRRRMPRAPRALSCTRRFGAFPAAPGAYCCLCETQSFELPRGSLPCLSGCLAICPGLSGDKQRPAPRCGLRMLLWYSVTLLHHNPHMRCAATCQLCQRGPLRRGGPKRRGARAPRRRRTPRWPRASRRRAPPTSCTRRRPTRRRSRATRPRRRSRRASTACAPGPRRPEMGSRCVAAAPGRAERVHCVSAVGAQTGV